MRLFLLSALSFLSSSLLAQNAVIEGKVTDSKTGQPVSRVSVVDKATGKGTATDQEGNYQLSVPANTTRTLVFSFLGITQEVTDIRVTGGATVQDLAFLQREKNEQEVVVRSSSNARRETAASMISFQKNTNTVASVISAESIRRSPDRNTGEILKRTPGASIQEGRFIIVRGLADRYNQAMLNGILLTSTEPDRKTFSFDLIPAAMIDNIVINKAFVPELPGEFAGGLIQVNTKDIPSKSFFNIQLGTGFNTQTTGKDFLKDVQGGKWDWLGFDDGTRALPAGYTTKSNFDSIQDRGAKTAIGKAMRNAWSPATSTAAPNLSLQVNGGFAKILFGKKIGGSIALNYNRSFRFMEQLNRRNILGTTSGLFSRENSYDDDRFAKETVAGGLAVFSVQLNNQNKISAKAIINLNNVSAVTQRNGYDSSRARPLQTGYEFTFRQNTFFTGQLTGDHAVTKSLRFKWYGAFNILDGYSPDQRRLVYEREFATDPYDAIISSTLSQQSGSRVFQNLSDYIYTGGGDLAYTFKLWKRNQTVKAGYMLQIKDRLYDAQLFANHFPSGKDNKLLRALPANMIFAPENFGNGYDDKFAFDAIKNKNFRYMANTILNAGFLQLDNQFTEKLRVVYGLRVENYDQLVGSVKTYDPRHVYSQVTDVLPGINVTYKLNTKTNLRASASQTVIRPELRELSATNLYDFELNASVQGNPKLLRTKILNTDLRYELYPRAGEVISAGVFYKDFKDPIEQIFDEGSGGASTFSYRNPESAYSYGAEFEFRKKLDVLTAGLKNFTFQTNLSLIRSRVSDSALDIDRPLQGQSNYVLNGGILYDVEKLGLNVTALFNIIGRRIFLVGTVSQSAGTPEVWEKPRPLFDLQVAKKVIRSKGEIRLTASDILNQRQIFYQNNTTEGNFEYKKNADALRFTRRYGTTFNLSFNYTL